MTRPSTLLLATGSAIIALSASLCLAQDGPGEPALSRRLDEFAGSLVIARFDRIEDALDELGPEAVLLVDCGSGGGVERLGVEGGGDFLALAHDPHPFSTLGRLLLSDRVWRKRPCPPKSSRFEAIWTW